MFVVFFVVSGVVVTRYLVHVLFILVSFGCYFGIILGLFRWHVGALGNHLATPGSQDASGIDYGSILGPFGIPWGTLRGVFSVLLATLGAPKPKKTTHWRMFVRGPDFTRIFSSLFGCLGILKPRIPCGRGVQNHIFNRSRKKHDS